MAIIKDLSVLVHKIDIFEGHAVIKKQQQNILSLSNVPFCEMFHTIYHFILLC